MIKVLNPYDESLIAELRLETESEVLSKLAQAHALFKDRSKWLPPYQRIQILEKFYQLITEEKEELIKTAAREGGKPYTDSKIEIERGLEGVKIAIREMAQLKGEEIPMGLTPSSTHRLALTIREPRGVVVAISAFNHPFNLIIHQVIPALAAGCPVIVKPAMATPLSCSKIVDSFKAAGLPAGWCSMVLCDHDVAEKLVTDSRTRFLTFIGSAKVGWYLRSKLPPGAGCALEHGGVAPVIMDESADFKRAIPLLIKGGFYHAGQVCVSVQRVYVPASKVQEFCEGFVMGVKKLKVGDPLDKATEVGPLILPKEVDRIHDWVVEAREKGGEVLCGGEKLSNTCYASTVILNPPDDVRVSKQEVFGPVVCVYSYKTRDEAIKRANALPVSFQAAIFAQDIDVALDSAQRLKGMAVMINDHTAFRVDWMPFGGTEESGLGIGGIGYSMKEMSLEKLIVIKTAS